MKNLFLFLLLFAFSGIIGQSNSPLDKKTQKKYDKAIECLMKKGEEKYLDRILEIVDLYPEYTTARKDLTTYYLKSGDKESALPHLLILAESDDKLSPRVGGELIDIYADDKEFDKAIAIAQKVIADNRLRKDSEALLLRRIDEMKFRKEAYAKPLNFEIEKLDSNINTSHSEYLPSFNADGSTIIFTRRNIDNNYSQEDLYTASLKEDSTFSEAVMIESLNTEENEGAHSFSANGRILIYTACDRRDSYGGCDLYISFLKNGTWTPGRNMGPKINTRFWESQPCLSADNKTLYFSSERSGGHGKRDIWKSSIQKVGGWSDPVNLGDTINTKANEQSPFLHPDLRTLYFESDGHIGMGKGDIFFSKRNAKSWNQPTNLGYPINDENNQGALFVDLQGEYAYFASQDTSSQNESYDIYKFKLPPVAKPEPSGYFKVTVIDGVSKKPLSASVILKSIDLNEPNVFSTDQNGEAIATLTVGTYALIVDKKEYIFHSENISIDPESSIIEPIEFLVELNPVPKEETTATNEPIILKNIFFETGSANLLPSSDFEIQRLYNLLASQENLKIEIIGHTDNIGQEKDNLRLSEDRAKSVYSRLIDKGIESGRISYRGDGEANPIASNETEEGRQLNRRTEFIIKK